MVRRRTFTRSVLLMRRRCGVSTKLAFQVKSFLSGSAGPVRLRSAIGRSLKGASAPDITR